MQHVLGTFVCQRYACSLELGTQKRMHQKTAVLQADIESQARRMEAQVTAAQAAAAAAQAEKGSTQDQVQRLEGEKASIQRQLDEVSAQLQQERAKANDLETKGTVASTEANVCLSCTSAPVLSKSAVGCAVIHSLQLWHDACLLLHVYCVYKVQLNICCCAASALLTWGGLRRSE